MNKLAPLFFAWLLLLGACHTARKARDRERAYNKPYHRADTELRVRMFVFHGADDLSGIYYKLDNSQLLYKKIDTSAFFTARIKFFYKFLPAEGSAQILDSGTVYVEDKSSQQPAKKMLSGYFPVKLAAGQNLHLEVFAEDVFGKKNHTYYLPAEKLNAYSQQNFLIESVEGDALFSNKAEQGSSVRLTNKRVGFTKARVDYYRVDYSLPPPPFSQKEPMLYPSIPDSTFWVASEANHAVSLKISRQGIYYIRLDSSNAGGCTLLGVGPGFPRVQSHEQMIAASRYIMNRDEYQKLISAADKQAAIEAFWLSIAGNNERAKELIKRYYNRVQDANSFFTSHIEGWKTDMGMIYIIFGTPAKTYKTANMESWEYFIQNAPPLTFRFEKINNPFSENCFKLQRTINYKDPWTIAVSYWREGRVYLED